jgi:YidC/Oxa1 family membrane protein insertase
MDKQTTVAFVLIAAILMIWLYISTPPPEPQKAANKQISSSLNLKDSIDNKKDEPKQEPAKTEPKQDTSAAAKNFASANAPERIITVENDLVRLELSSRGGKISRYFLKKFNNWYVRDLPANAPDNQKNIQLLNYDKGSSLDVSFITLEGKVVNSGALDFTADANKYYYKISNDDSLSIVYTYKSVSNSVIKKKFVFYGNKYSSRLELELFGMNNQISNNQFDFTWKGGLRFVEENSADESNAGNSSVYYGGEQVIVDAKDAGQKVEKDFNGNVSWMEVRNKYFTAIVIPDNATDVDGAYIEGHKVNYPNTGVNKFYNTSFKMPFNNSDYEKKAFTVYIGPVNYSLLKSYNKNLESIVDFGSFLGLKIIVRPIAEYILLPLFNFLHSFIPNYGLVIIIFSLIIKFALYPFTKSSMYSMKKMQMLQPKINELKEKYKDDQAKQSQETMKLYSTYGINPAGGCLPLLLQMPIFVALWGLFQTAVELRQQHFFLWINDLSRPDIIYNLGFKLPLVNVEHISGLALLMGVTTFVQQKMTVKDPKQAAMVYMMPIMLTLMFMNFPSGLNLYYFMFNLFSIGQQYYVNMKHDDMVLEPVKNPKKKGGFMERMMEAAEKNQKANQQLKKKK